MIQLTKLFISFLFFFTAINKQNPSAIISKVKTDKSFLQSSLDPKSIYAIDIERIATNKQDQSSKCEHKQKQIKSLAQFQKFRVGSQHTRQQSVYQSLTTLSDRQNGIDTFKILGEKVMVVMMNGTAYFLSNNKELQNNPKPVDLKVTTFAGDYKFKPIIAPINGNAFVATARDLSFCQPKINKCTKIEGYKQVDALFNFQAYQFQGKMYLFFISGNSMTTYEVSTNGAVYNERTFRAQFFNRQKIFICQVAPVPGNKILILDFYAGVFQVQHSASSLADLKNVKGVVYEQYGCRNMASQKSGQSLALQCSLTKKTFFILQLGRSEKSTNYTAHQPIFLNQVLTGIQTNNQIIMANIYTGIRLFWASSDIDTPYPYDYQNAGAIFLHNAKASQFWTLNDRKVIFICTEDELRIYQLSVVTPQIVCYSLVPIKQQYKVTYTYLCDQQGLLHQKVCTLQKKFSYEAWQHKQVGFKTTILPLLVSSLLVLCVGILLIKLYKKYDKQIENTRLKYDSNSQFGI